MKNNGRPQNTRSVVNVVNAGEFSIFLAQMSCQKSSYITSIGGDAGTLAEREVRNEVRCVIISQYMYMTQIPLRAIHHVPHLTVG